MKITVAVPSYNYAQFLEACLSSIQQQSHPDFEVLIADGGSQDGSLEIIRRYCETDARFRLVSTSDNGQADAIRKAFAHANGDVLCFLNADDCFLDQEVFSQVLEDLRQHPDVSVLTYGGYYLDAEGRRIKKINYRYHPFDGFHWMRYRTAVIQPATFWRSVVYQETDWPAQYHFVFDVVFFYRAFLKYKWLESAHPVAGYRLHGDNKSMTVRPERIRELAAFEEIKFGANSLRAQYLRCIAWCVDKLAALGRLGHHLTRGLYLVVNSLAFLSFYRLPGI